MNDVEDTTNIYNCSDSYNNRDDNCSRDQISQIWGTWEDLVLTYAVKRHGFRDWDSVAKEVCSRSSLNFSPQNCRLKFQDLKRRFQDSVDGGCDNREINSKSAIGEDEVGEIPWLKELRNLRVAELRQKIQRNNDSILSLQLKIKKLEEEKYGNDDDKKPDLEAVRSESDEPARLNRETTESDRQNISINESNSTASVYKIADHERLSKDKMVKAYDNSRNPDSNPTVAEDEERTVNKRSGMSQSGELGESGTSTDPGKRKGHKYRNGGSGGAIKSAGNKSQPLIEIIMLIRSHPRGSVFESQLRSQKTKEYKKLIRQHLDIKTIEKKMKTGSYISSNLSFYRDLKLLFTNAIVFYPLSSSESMAAQELRTLVSNEMKKQTGKLGYSFIKPEAESSVSRQKYSVPSLVACKKKNSTKSQEVSEEKTITINTRSTRRNKKTENDDNEENPKTEKKIVSGKKKSMVDFLNRIKKNSPEKKETKTRELRSNSKSKKKVEVEENRNKSSLKRKQPEKEAEEVTVVTGKRSRESGKDNKPVKKRSKR